MTLIDPAADELASIRLHRLRLALRQPFRSSHGVETLRDVLLVRWERPDGHLGWGECPTLAHPTYTAEYTDGAFQLLASWVIPSLVAGQPVVLEGWPMTVSALRTAALDARLRSEAASLSTYLGATATSVPAGAVLGEADDLDQLMRLAEEQLAAGASLLKLKIRPGYDVEPFRAVMTAWPALEVAADANGAYGQPDDLAALSEIDLAYLEQPLRPTDLLGHSELCRRGFTVALDESVVDPGGAALAVHMGAARVLSVKPARVGGVDAAREIRDIAVDGGIALFCGGMLETVVGRAAALAVAAMPGFGIPTDLGPSDRYFAEDIAAPIVRNREGRVEVPAGRGIGIEPDARRLAEVTVDERCFTR